MAALLIFAVLCFAALPAAANIESDASRAYYEEAVRHAGKGDLKSAVIELKNALQRDPKNADARLLLGEVYLKLGNGAAAEKELRAAERHGLPATQTALPLARALLLQGKFNEVLSGFDAAAYGPETAFEIGLLRAEALGGLGKPDAARVAYEEVAQLNAGDARPYLGLAGLDLAEKKFDEAEAHAVAALERSPGLVEARMARAEARRLKGEPEAALPLYREILDDKSTPASVAVRGHFGLASALIVLGRDKDAEAEIRASQAIAPNSPLAAYLQSLIQVRARDFEAAGKSLAAVSPALDDFPPAQFLFGVVYYAASELETARSWLIRHLRAHPENLQARKLLAVTLLRLNATPDAIAMLQAGLAQASDDPQLLMLLGNAYIRSGRSAEASELLQRAAELAPKDPQILSQLAISSLAMGQNEQALSALNSTLDLGADASLIGYALAFVHLRSGAFDEALKVAQGLRERFPESAMAANLEGGAFAALGQLDKARASFEAVLAIDPKFDQARVNLAALKAQTGDLDAAEADYRTVLESDGNNVAALLGLAAVAETRGDAAATRRWLKTAVEKNPEAVKPALMLARSYAAEDDVPAALTLLDRLSRQPTPNPQVLAELGAMQGRAGKPADALRTYKRLMEVAKGTPDARLLLAQAHFAAGEPQDARRVLEEALAANPDHLQTVEALIRLVTQLDGAEATFAYAEQLRRRYPDALWGDQLIGDLHRQSGRLAEGINAYEAGWAKHPSAPLAVALFQARMQAGGAEKTALASLREWLALQPGDDTVRLALAAGLLSFGDRQAALAEYEALKETQSGNPIVWNNLAWLYQQAGDRRAVDHGERALALAPDQPAIMDTLGWILVDQGEAARAAALLQRAHLAAPDSADIAFHYAVALHRNADDAAAVTVLKTLLGSEKPFQDRAEAAELLGKLAP